MMSAVDFEGNGGMGRGATEELAVGLELNSWLGEVSGRFSGSSACSRIKGGAIFRNL